MVLFDIAFALELIALTAGVSILLWAMRNKGAGIVLAKTFGYIVTILAVILLVCSAISSVTWKRQQAAIQSGQSAQPPAIQKIKPAPTPAAATKKTSAASPSDNKKG